MSKDKAITQLKFSFENSINNLKDIEKLVETSTTVNNQAIFMECFSRFNFLAAHSYIIDKDPAAFRLWSYHAGLSTRSLGLMENGFDNILLSLSYSQGAILSDHYPLIRDVVNWRSKYHEESYKRGALFYIAQQLIAGDYDQADALWVKGKSHLEKKLNFFMEERRAMRALIDKDPEALKEALYDMLTPAMIKKTHDPIFVQGYFYHSLALTYVKFAHFLGLFIEIDHELVPRDLQEFAPLDKYEVQYDFMKPAQLPED
jgi:hypothetical protein